MTTVSKETAKEVNDRKFKEFLEGREVEVDEVKECKLPRIASLQAIQPRR
jgi:hypothetical protein